MFDIQPVLPVAAFDIVSWASSTTEPHLPTCMQIGYCGLDGEPEHGAMPGAPVNGDASLDIDVYCKGYVAWDFMAMFVQVQPTAMHMDDIIAHAVV